MALQIGATIEESTLEQLATHLPDLIIHRSPHTPIPETINSYGVVFFGDISGFTALCEKYCSNSVSKKKGTDQLTSTLNSYLTILETGGDVLKFAGDALLAHWPCNRVDANGVVQYLIQEVLTIQTNLDNYQTADGVLLRMKIALSVGKSYIHYIGNDKYKTFDITGPAVDEVNVAQSVTKPGAVVITKTAWEMCDQDRCTAISVGKCFFQIEGNGDTLTHSMQRQLMIQPAHEYHSVKHMMITSSGSEDLLHTEVPHKLLTVKEHGLILRKEIKKLLPNLSEEARSGLKTYILRTVVRKIDHGYDVSWLSELRQVSVLFINLDPDLSLSTDITARGKKEQLLLQTAFECVYPPLVKYDGTLNKVFMFDKGCTFLCIFGLPHGSHEDDPYRALKAAKEIFNALDNIRLSHYSIGVTTGIAFCGVVGHHERHEYTVIGEKVNMAARLMIKFPDAITCDESTRSKSNLSLEQFVQTPPIKLKGISHLEDVYFVSTEHEDNIFATQSDIHEQTDFENLIGRTSEMDMFLTELQHVAEHTHRDPGVIIISGPGGIGKTKLLRAMKAKAANMGFRVVSGIGGLIEQNTPFFTVKTLLTRLLELDTCVNIHDKEQLILRHITDEEMRKYLPLLNDLLVLKFPQTSLTLHMCHKERIMNLHKLLFSIVHQEALTKPCVFGVDDAQWMDHDSWAFILDLALDPNAVLILSMRPIKDKDRSQVMSQIWNHPHTVVLNIEGLSSTETVNFVCQLLNVDEIDHKVADIICTRSHGIPLWCEELVETMLETDVLEVIEFNEMIEEETEEMISFELKEAERTVLRNIKRKKCVINPMVGIKDIPIPESVAGVVLTRIDNMTPSEQMILKCAAILGKGFHSNMLQAILPNKSLYIFQQSINSLAEHGFIECSIAAAVKGQNICQNVPHLQCPCLNHLNHNAGHHIPSSSFRLDECELLQFVHAYVLETANNLWTENQCQSLHEKAALYLESQAHKCINCGGGNFTVRTEPTKNKRTSRTSTPAGRAFIGTANIRHKRHRSSSERRKTTTSQRKSSELSWRSSDGMGRSLSQLRDAWIRDRPDRPSQATIVSPFDSICSPEDMALDFQDCHCDEVLAHVYPQLVYHWKLAGNMTKTLHYLVEAATVSLATYNNMEAVSLLEEAEQILCEYNIGKDKFGLLQQAKLQSLFGQAYYQSGEINECLRYFQRALHILNNRIPTSRLGVLSSFIWQVQKQYFHIKYPRRYLGKKQGQESDKSIERSRCMAHIVHVYHLQHKNFQTFMTALHQLNAAEEAQEDTQELLEAYATIIECCQLYNYKRLGEVYFKKSIALCFSIEFGVEELPTCAHLLNVALNLKLCEGSLDVALEIGSAVTRITSKVHHVPMKLAALPFLFYANLLKMRHGQSSEIILLTCMHTDRKDQCEETIRQLKEVAIESDDLRAQAVLDCCQFDALLDIGFKSEEGARLASSAESCCHEDFYHFDDVERFFLVSCLTLWYIRGNNVLANKFILVAKSLFPTKFETYFSVRALAKFNECSLALYSETPRNSQKKQHAKKALNHFKLQLNKFPVFKSQYLHLMGSYHYINNNKAKAERILRKSLYEGEVFMCTLDCQRAQDSLQKWF